MYICSNCQKEYSKWQGQCTNCLKWGTLVEVQGVKKDKKNSKISNPASLKAPVKLKDIDIKFENSLIKTGFEEFDNVLGGRIVSGQVVLLSGEPGVGKSTLMLQVIESFSKQKIRVLYICGEESPYQIKQRADRLKLSLDNVSFFANTNIREIENYLVSHINDFDILVVDSIQTVYDPNVTSISGSMSQVSECTNILVNIAKGFNKTTFIIGHVTKNGEIAGPKILEHMVDTVLYFEGERRYQFRILRVEKNRFGPSDEVGIFKMAESGLQQVIDTKELFDNKKEEEPGSVYSMVMEGTRPVVVEVQALATKTYFSNPRRTTSGFDLNRFFILLAIIDKKLGLDTGGYDIYLNITGGIKINDTAIDLAIIAAVVSSMRNKKVDKKNIFFGEVGLTGEVRKVYLQEKRIKESKRLDFDKFYYSESLKNIAGLEI